MAALEAAFAQYKVLGTRQIKYTKPLLKKTKQAWLDGNLNSVRLHKTSSSMEPNTK